jgi:hypothetical protein
MHGSNRSITPAGFRRFFAMCAAHVALCVASISVGFAAGTYDEKVRAPQDVTPLGLQKLARNYLGLFSDGSRSMLDVLGDRVLYSQWVELRWHLSRALDRGTLGDALAEFGITSKGDGSYDVDLKRYPQWSPLQITLSSFLSPANRDHSLQYLKSRGLSDAGVQGLRAYLEANPYPTHEGGVSPITQDQLAESFAVRVQAKQLRGQRLQRTETMSFVYQRFRLMEEQSRTWGLALFNSVDPRGQQILETFGLETQGVMSMAGSDPEERLTETEQGFVNGEILQRIQADKVRQQETR